MYELNIIYSLITVNMFYSDDDADNVSSEKLACILQMNVTINEQCAKTESELVPKSTMPVAIILATPLFSRALEIPMAHAIVR